MCRVPLILKRCLSWRKDKNFKANHNSIKLLSYGISDVCLGAKIRILKQITTCICYFFSIFRCLSWRKDKNFKANHNKKELIKNLPEDVCLSAKIRILKQITTQ